MESSSMNLLTLPAFLLEVILSTLDAKQLLRVSSACKRLHAICHLDALWLRKYLHSHPKRIRYKGSWRATVLELEGAPEGSSTTSKLKWEGLVLSLYHQRLEYRCSWKPCQAAIPATCLPIELCTAHDGCQPGFADSPQVWTGLMQSWTTDKWRRAEYWQSLLGAEFRVAKPYGGSCLMPLLEYFQYARLQQDEEPLYIFDESFGKRAPQLLNDYSLPPGAPEDLFEVLGEGRPDFRWLVMGPVRSGSSWHQDPSGTFAWNALVAGQKRWLFYPPHVVPPGVKLIKSASGDLEVSSPNPVKWLLEVLPTLSEAMLPYEHLQKPGEIVFLPSRWWHFIINLEDTVAVTQNYVPEHGLEAAVRELALGPVCHSLAEPCSTSGIKHSGSDQPKILAELQGAQEQAVTSNSGPCPVDQQEAENEVTGFRRSRNLGAWMRALMQRKPELKQQVSQLASVYAELSAWSDALSKACRECELLPPDPEDCFPISGGPTVIFQVHDDVIIKFYARDEPLASLDAVVERAALQHLSRNTPDQHSSFPQVLGFSTLALSADLSNAAASISSLPWIAISKCTGQSLVRVNMIPEAAASALGTVIAQLHSIEAPAFDMSPQHGDKAGTSQEPPSRGAKGSASNATDGPSAEDTSQKQSLYETQQGNARPGYRITNLLPWFKDEAAWETGSRDFGCLGISHQPWEPFLTFLRRRRREVQGSMNADAALPLHLLTQLDTYLPVDIGDLLPRGADLPVWPRLLHGDLSPGNILLKESASARDLHSSHAGYVSIIDFGDAGYGDPLFDLPPLHILSLRGNVEMTRSFLMSYAANTSNGTPWLQARAEKEPSYSAMCYTLLHEQDILSAVFERQPELWEASSLKALQHEIWGFLDL